MEDFWLFSSCAGVFLVLDLIIKYLSKIKHRCILIYLATVHASECECKTGLVESLCQ